VEKVGTSHCEKVVTGKKRTSETERKNVRSETKGRNLNERKFRNWKKK